MPYTTLPGTRAPVKVWTDPFGIEPQAQQQLRNIGNLPWVEGVAVMPDVHFGMGATVGSVIAMRQALAPAAVGVDIGCGMSAVRTSLKAEDLPDDLGRLRSAIEATIPVGFDMHREPINPRQVHGLPTAGWDEFWAGFDRLHANVRGWVGGPAASWAPSAAATTSSKCVWSRVGRTLAGCGSCCTPVPATSARSWPTGTST